MKADYVLRIEPAKGERIDHPLQPLTDKAAAKELAAQLFSSRNKNGMATRTIALTWGGKIVDVYDGDWSSNRYWALLARAPCC